jgi:hypothetical protein
MSNHPRAAAYLEEVIACYEKNRQPGKLAAKDIAEECKLDPRTWDSAWSKIRSGTVRASKRYEEVLVEFFKECFNPAKLKEAYEQKYVDDLENWEPVVGIFHWPPFCDQHEVEKEKGFLVDVARRFFRLASKPAKFEQAPLSKLLSGAGGIDLSLAIAETIPRTQRVTNFHTPGRMGINLVGKFDSKAFLHARNVLTGAENGGKKLRVVTVKDEVGCEYIQSLPSHTPITSEHLKAPSDNTLCGQIKPYLTNDWLYCADELTCLHMLATLKGSDIGLLFPLGTPQVTSSEQYARLPSHKIGFFTVPEYQDKIIAFLHKALRVYLENEHEEIAQQYAELYKNLVTDVIKSIASLPAEARQYLFQAHIDCKDGFHAGEDKVGVLADRWARQTLRLYPGQPEQDLNLPWNPILDRARSLVGPVRSGTRTPGERCAAVTYRELPPVIYCGTENKPAEFSIFGAVLEPLRPHIDLGKADRFKRSQAQSHLGSDNPATVAVGFFAVPPRLFDWRFFCFPIRLRFAGALLGEAGPEHEQECRAVLGALQSGCHEVLDPKLVRVLLLNHGATHNLLRDHGLSGEGDMFPLIDDTDKDRGRAFLEEWAQKPEIPAVVIADEITCLEVAGVTTGPFKLLNHRLAEEAAGFDGTGAGAYFSVAVRSSAPDWIRFFEQAIPLALELYRERIAEAHRDLFCTLKKWTQAQLPGLDPERVDTWCRSVLLLDRPESLSPPWTPVLERARQLTRASGALGAEA